MNSNNKNYSITPVPQINQLTEPFHYVGLFFSAIWIIIAIYCIISTKNINNKLIIGKTELPYSKYYYIIPILLLLLGIGNISYYIIERNSPNISSVNIYVFIISQVPLLISFFLFCIELNKWSSRHSIRK